MWLFHGCDPSLTFLTVKTTPGDRSQRQQEQEPAGAAVAAEPRTADDCASLLAALLAATHSAAMECYRHGTAADQKPEGRRESLSQANELVLSCTALMQAIDRHRGEDGSRS